MHAPEPERPTWDQKLGRWIRRIFRFSLGPVQVGRAPDESDPIEDWERRKREAQELEALAREQLELEALKREAAKLERKQDRR